MRTLIFSVVLAAFLFWPTAGSAGHLCRDYAVSAQNLGEIYAEAVAARGLSTSGSLTVLFRSESGETWTLLVVGPDGMTCAIAAGTDWESVDWVQPSEIIPQSF